MTPQPTTPLDILDAQRYRWLRRHLTNRNDESLAQAFADAGFEDKFPTESEFDAVVTAALQQEVKV